MPCFVTLLRRSATVQELTRHLAACRAAGGGAVAPQHKAEAARSLSRFLASGAGFSSNPEHCAAAASCVRMCIGQDAVQDAPPAPGWDVWEGLGAVVAPEETVDVLRAVTAAASVQYTPPAGLHAQLERSLVRAYPCCEAATLAEALKAFSSCRHAPRDLLVRAAPAFGAAGGARDVGLQAMAPLLSAYLQSPVGAAGDAVFAACAEEVLRVAEGREWGGGRRAGMERYVLLKVYAKYIREAPQHMQPQQRALCARAMAALGAAVLDDTAVDAVQAFIALRTAPPDTLATQAARCAPRRYVLALHEGLVGLGVHHSHLFRRVIAEEVGGVNCLAHHAAVHSDAAAGGQWLVDALMAVARRDASALTAAGAAALCRVILRCEGWGGGAAESYAFLEDRVVALLEEGRVDEPRTHAEYAAFLSTRRTKAHAAAEVVLDPVQSDGSVDTAALRNVLSFAHAAGRVQKGVLVVVLSGRVVGAVVERRVEGVDAKMLCLLLGTLCRSGDAAGALRVHAAWPLLAEELARGGVPEILNVLAHAPPGEVAEAAFDAVDMLAAREGFGVFAAADVVAVLHHACRRLKLRHADHFLLLWAEHAFRHGLPWPEKLVAWALTCAAPAGAAVHPLIALATHAPDAPLQPAHAAPKHLEAILRACAASDYDSPALRDAVYEAVCRRPSACNVARLEKAYLYFNDRRVW